MKKDRTRIERQLELARKSLDTCEKSLQAAGVTGKQLAKDTKWRSLNADYRQLRRRLLAVKAVEEREAAAAQRKAEKLSGAIVEE